MRKQKTRDAGITLIALVISIIIMLILAGVSLNAMVGENGILTMAMQAVSQSKIAEELEGLNHELTNLNIETMIGDETTTISDIAQALINKGVIDSVVTTSAGQIAAGIDVATNEQYFFGNKNDNTYRILRSSDGMLTAELASSISGGDVTGGYALVTADSFDSTSDKETEKGKFTISSDAEVVFMDEISGQLSIYVKSGVHAIVGIYATMELTNSGIPRSAIDIEEGGILDLYIGEGVSVIANSGFGDAGADSDASTVGAAKGGAGAHAGIHVPAGAILNVYGKGILYAYGGNAGNGGGTSNGGKGGAGGGGAGAGIGGDGGAGGDGSIASSTSGKEGNKGEDCGEVNIYNRVTVYAYGGAGGSGGVSSSSSGGGAGGYPGAGIGGGGAGAGGGDHVNGGGGYTGGNQEKDGLSDPDLAKVTPINGNAGNPTTITNTRAPGGGYFAKGGDAFPGGDYDSRSWCYGGALGGGGGINNFSRWGYSFAGDGGVAGKGGSIKVSSASTINAYNGNECTLKEKKTDGTINEEYYYKPLEIYIQNGKLIKVVKSLASNYWNDELNRKYSDILGITVNLSPDTNDFISLGTIREEDTIEKLNYVLNGTKYYVGQGIGSGAGYIELDNGTYTVNPNMNGTN